MFKMLNLLNRIVFNVSIEIITKKVELNKCINFSDINLDLHVYKVIHIHLVYNVFTDLGVTSGPRHVVEVYWIILHRP